MLIFLTQLPFAAVDVLYEKGKQKAIDADRTRRDAEDALKSGYSDLDRQLKNRVITPTEFKMKKEIRDLSKVPVAERTDGQSERINELNTALADLTYTKMQETGTAWENASVKSDLFPESPATVTAQLDWMTQGKRKAVLDTHGLKNVSFPFVETEQGKIYYDPNKVTEEQVQAHVETDTLGDLFDYGVPRKPEDGSVAVSILDHNGLEKQSVVSGPKDLESVIQAAHKIKDATDEVVVETADQTIARRNRNKDTLELYSVNLTEPGDKYFVNNILDNLRHTVDPKSNKLQARLKVSREDGTVNYTELNKLFKKWVGDDVYAWYSEQLPDPKTVTRINPDEFAKIIAENTPEIEIRTMETRNEAEVNSYANNPLRALNTVLKVDTDLDLNFKPKGKDGIEFTVWSDELNSGGDHSGDVVRGTVKNDGTLSYDIDSDAFSLHIQESNRRAGRTQFSLDTADRVLRGTLARLRDYNFGAMPEGATFDFGRTTITEEFSYINPLDLSQMDNPVDILVRAPQAKEEFRGNHYGEEGKGLVVHARGYFKGDEFIMYELQSDLEKDARTGAKKSRERLEKTKRQYQERNDLAYGILAMSDDQKTAFIELLKKEDIFDENKNYGTVKIGDEDFYYRGYDGSYAHFSKTPTGKSYDAIWLRLHPDDLVDVVKTNKDFDLLVENVIDISKRVLAKTKKEKALTPKEIAVRDYGDSGLLINRAYELGIKAALRYAADKGATKFSLVDAETSAMIQGHTPDVDTTYAQLKDDKVRQIRADNGTMHYVLESNIREHDGKYYVPYNGKGSLFSDPNVVQVVTGQDLPLTTAVHSMKGMWNSYDKMFVKALEKITGQKGKQGTLIRHIKQRTNVFKNEDGQYYNKVDATGKTFDISNLPSEPFNLFSLFDAPKQANFEGQIAKEVPEFEQQMNHSDPLSLQETLDLIFNSNLKNPHELERAAIGKVVNSIKTTLPALIRPVGLSPASGGLLRGLQRGTQEIGLNLVQAFDKKIMTLTHELSHVSLKQFKETDSYGYRSYVDAISAMPVLERKAALSDLAKVTDTEGLPIDYLAGERFDPRDPTTREKIAHEFTAGIVEMLTNHALKTDTKVGTRVQTYLNFLPLNIQLHLTKFFNRLSQLLGPNYPSGAHMLSDPAKNRLFKALKLLEGTVLEAEQVNYRAFELLGNTEKFSPDSFIDATVNGLNSQLADSYDYLPDDARLAAVGLAEDAMSESTFQKASKKAQNFYETWFMSGLFRARIHPWTRPLFDILHSHRRKILQQEMDNFSFLGQDENRTLSQEDSQKAYSDWERDITDPFKAKANQGRVNKMVNVMDEIQEKIRSGEAVDIPEVSEMVKMGLKQRDAEMARNFLEMAQQIGLKQFQVRRKANDAQMARLLVHRDPTLTTQDAIAIAEVLGPIFDRAGYLQMQISRLRATLKNSEVDGEKALLNEKIKGLQEQLVPLHNEIAQRLLVSRGEKLSLGLDGELMSDKFMQRFLRLGTKLGEARVEFLDVIKDPGYLPKVRSRRFQIVEYKTKIDGKKQAVNYTDFDTFKEAKAYAQRKKLEVGTYRFIDLNETSDRYQSFQPAQVAEIKEQMRAELNLIAERMLKDGATPEEVKLVRDIQDNFQPNLKDIEAAVSFKGKKYFQRTYNIPGFRKADYLKNLVEYSHIQTVTGQKMLSSALADLEMATKQYKENPEVLNRSRRDKEYAINSSDHKQEARTVKKGIFYFYLGASIRHFLQNSMQTVLNGIPQLVADGHGYMKSYETWGKSGLLLRKWFKDGTTGDKTLDSLLKSADKEGVTLPAELEAFLDETARGGSSLNSLRQISQGDRNTLVMPKAKHMGAMMLDRFEKIMRSTAIISEQGNRRMGFIMGYLDAKQRGITDVNEMFKRASRFTDDVNFVGDKANRPGFVSSTSGTWLHAPVLVMTAMQTFVINHLSQIYTFWKEGNIGALDPTTGQRSTDRGIKNKANQALVMSISHLALLSGMMGLPFLDDLEQIIEKLSGGKLSLRSEFRKMFTGDEDEDGKSDLFGMDVEGGGTLSDTFLFGLPALLGVDATGSLGLGKIFGFYAGDSPSESLTSLLLGPSYGIIEKGTSAARELIQDPTDPVQLEKAGRLAAPFSISQFVRMADAFYNNTQFDRKVQPLVDGLSAKFALGTITGFRPLEAVNAQRARSRKSALEQQAQRHRSRAVEQIAKNLFEYKRTGEVSYLNRANEDFDKFLELHQGRQGEDSLITSVSDQMQRFEEPYRQNEGLIADNFSRAVDQAYPEVATPVQGQITSALSGLEVSQLLGQTEEYGRRAQSLSSTIRQKAIVDALVQAGVEPAYAALLASIGTKEGLQRSRRLLDGQDPYFEELVGPR
jgi:hypothetical protein